jgi:hypothetical protein
MHWLAGLENKIHLSVVCKTHTSMTKAHTHTHTDWKWKERKMIYQANGGQK